METETKVIGQNVDSTKKANVNIDNYTFGAFLVNFITILSIMAAIVFYLTVGKRMIYGYYVFAGMALLLFLISLSIFFVFNVRRKFLIEPADDKEIYADCLFFVNLLGIIMLFFPDQVMQNPLILFVYLVCLIKPVYYSF